MLNVTFGALADPTRRAILAKLAQGRGLGAGARRAVRHDAAGDLQAPEGAGARRPDRARPRRAAPSLPARAAPPEAGGRLDRHLSRNSGKRATTGSTITCRTCKRRRSRVTSKKLEIIAEPGKTSFTTRRIVDAPRALVFDAFTKCEHLKHWMGPRSLTMVELRDRFAGGRPLPVRVPHTGRQRGRLQRRVQGSRRAPSGSSARSCSSRCPTPRRSRRSSSRSGRQDDDHDDDAAQDRRESRRSREQRHGSRHDGRVRAARRAARRPSADALIPR